MKYAQYLIDAVCASIRAGAAILDVYQSDFKVEIKNDQSPLTLADQKSHQIIEDGLKHHGLPFISEEGRAASYEERSQWKLLWIVDPLDGTREFVKRNGEFTVNIALIEDQKPIMGVVYAPVNQWLYFAATDIGAYKLAIANPHHIHIDGSMYAEKQVQAMMDEGERLPIRHSERNIYTIVGSRSHGTTDLNTFIEEKKQVHGDVDFIPAGSSLKICLVAEGAADIYPRLGPTMEWDTAAGQAIAECAGANMFIYDHRKSLKYNRRNLLNPWFIVER